MWCHTRVQELRYLHKGKSWAVLGVKWGRIRASGRTICKHFAVRARSTDWGWKLHKGKSEFEAIGKDFCRMGVSNSWNGALTWRSWFTYRRGPTGH